MVFKKWKVFYKSLTFSTDPPIVGGSAGSRRIFQMRLPGCLTGYDQFLGKGIFVGMNLVWIELTNQNIASTMVKLCCGIFFPSLTYVTPLYTTCHLFHENHPIHPLDQNHDHLAVETLVCGVAPPQTLDQSCSCRDLPANDFLVLPFLICCFYSEGFRIYHLSSQLTCWNASAAVSVALSEQIRSRESPE